MNSIKEIKESARQSYLDQQTQDNEGGCADAVSYIGGFTAGAKWMQEKNAKEIEQLRTKIEQERSHIRTCHIAMEGHHKEIEQLKQRLEIAVEHLKFTTHAAEYLYKPDVNLNKNMTPTFYFTLTYEGDLELVERCKGAMEFLAKISAEKEQ